MKTITRLASVAAFVGLVSQGCGQVENSDVETTQSALGTFPSWTQIPGKVVGDGPALALGTTLTAFGLGTTIPRQIFVTNKNSLGNWIGSWLQLNNFADGFATRPSATGFPGVTQGDLSNGMFAVVAGRSDGQYFLTICDQTNTVVRQSWIGVPNGLFSSAPAIAFIPPNSPNAPTATLVLAGRATVNDSRIWVATNTLVSTPQGLAYDNSKWTGFSPVFSKTFAGAPAIAYAYPGGPSDPTLMLAARDSSGQFWTSKFIGSSWTDWAPVDNGLFFDGPALSVAIGDNSFREIVIYGRGMDNHVYSSTQLSGGVVGFSAIGSDLFIGSPQALGQKNGFSTHGVSHVAAIKSGNLPFSNKALSP